MRAFYVATGILALSGLVSVSADAEPALARAVGDQDLEWGPCPEFMPAGCEIAALHGDSTKANADVYFRVPGGYDIPKHWHSSAERMIAIAGEMRLTYDGQDSVLLKPGMYGYGPARTLHAGRCVSDDPCTVFIAFEEPIDATPSP